MAALDKTYVNREQALQVIGWCKSVGEVTLENGYKFKPIDFVCLMDSLDLPNFGYKEGITEYCLWSTPVWFDRWLWVSCPLDYIKQRIKEQYDEKTIKAFEEFHYSKPCDQLDFGKQHYTFLEEPKWHGHKYWMSHGNAFINRRQRKRRTRSNQRISYDLIVVFPSTDNDAAYDKQTDCWGDKYFGMLPYEDWYAWNYNHKNPPTKKAIIRQLRKWHFPKGTIVKVVNWNYEALDYKILVK